MKFLEKGDVLTGFETKGTMGLRLVLRRSKARDSTQSLRKELMTRLVFRATTTTSLTYLIIHPT